MPYENIYIQKVAEHPHIWSDEAKMQSMKGKWRGYFQEQNSKFKKQNEGSFFVIPDK
jgi:hypothetical protein